MEFTLLFAALAAVGSAWLAGRVLGRPQAFETLLNATIGGVFAGRVWAMIAAGTNPLTNLADLIVIRGGVDPLGATIGALIVLAVVARRSGWATVDDAVPSGLFGLAGWHAACLITGSCLGAASSLPWAWADTGSTVTRHPVELYTALLLVASALFINRLRTAPAGTALGWGLAAAAVARLITEPLRLALGGGRTGIYLIGAVTGLAVVIGAAGVGRGRHQERTEPQRRARPNGMA